MAGTTQHDEVLGRVGSALCVLDQVMKLQDAVLHDVRSPDRPSTVPTLVVISRVDLPLHRDGDTWYRAQFADDILFSVNLALTDFRQQNGATVVVPGSHRWAQQRDPDDDELAFAEMSAGSALFYRGRLVHGGGANRTDETRVGLYFGYIPAWVRQQENPAVSMPPELLQGFDPELRQLLGVHPDGFLTVI